MGCSICGADGVTKQTCPFNPYSTSAKPRKHNERPLPGQGHGAATAVAVRPPIQKLKPVLKKPSVEGMGQAAASAIEFNRDAVQTEAAQMFPGNIALQNEYVADMFKLVVPRPPQNDEVSRAQRARMDKIAADRAQMADQCARCLRAIRGRNLVKPDQWFGVGQVCDQCHKGIGNLFHEKDFKEEYRNYHRSEAVSVDDLEAHGAKGNYYNGTMYKGAKYWADVAARRAGAAMPAAPKGRALGK